MTAVLFLANAVTLLVSRYTAHGNLFGLARLFRLDAEANVPTFVSALGLLACALGLALVARRARASRDPDARYWFGLSALALLMSFDEAAQIHELAIAPLRGGFGLDGIWFFSWVIPAVLVLLVVAALCARFVARLPRRTRTLGLLGAAVYLTGALGLEMVCASYASRGLVDTLAYEGLATLEETLELLGISTMLYTLMVHIDEHVAAVHISLGRDVREPTAGSPSVRAKRHRSVS